MDALTSRVISFLRFPLIVAVVFMHCDLTVGDPWLDERPVFHALMVLVLYVVSTAVPLFFFISGFLFFKEGTLNVPLYIRKMRSRLQTVFVPYILWNIIYFLVIAVAQLCNPNFLFILHKRVADFSLQDYLWVFWDVSRITHLPGDQHACLVGAFWFLQNLFVMFLLSPLVYVLVKYLRHFFLLFLLVLYATDVVPELVGLSMESVFYFSLGAYCSIMQIDFVALLKRMPLLLLALSVVSFVLVHTIGGRIVYLMSDILLMMTIVSLVACAIECCQWTMSASLVSSTFFVFAVHRFFTAAFTRAAHSLLPYIDGDWLSFLLYVFMVVVTVAISYTIYRVMLRLSPKVTSLLNGQR